MIWQVVLYLLVWQVASAASAAPPSLRGVSANSTIVLESAAGHITHSTVLDSATTVLDSATTVLDSATIAQTVVTAVGRSQQQIPI